MNFKQSAIHHKIAMKL